MDKFIVSEKEIIQTNKFEGFLEKKCLGIFEFWTKMFVKL
jgi:hypothetical protein